MDEKKLEGYNIWRAFLAGFVAVPIANAGFPEETSQKWEIFLAWVISFLAIQFLVNFPLERIEHRLKTLGDGAQTEKH